MLYDGALRFLEQAQRGFAADDPLEFNATIHNNIVRAQAILHELDVSLNTDAGGELALTLRRLYNYLDHRLSHSNQYKEDTGIRETAHRLKVLRDAWAEMLQQAAAPATSSAPLELAVA
jgi:flagellar protein FliS